MSVDYVNEKRLLKFSFANILLPDSNTNEMMSHGMISYSIRPYATLLAGEDITNRAAIYFDFNSAVVTNNVHTPVIFPSSVTTLQNKLKLVIYPNPARDEIRIRLPENFTSGEAEVFNTMGQRVAKAEIKQKRELSLPLRGLPQGMYFIKVAGEDRELRASFVISGK